MKRPRLALQAKYLILISAIILGSSGILSIYYYNATKNKEIQELKVRGRMLAINLSHNIEEGVLFSDKKQLNLLIDLVAEDSDVVAVEITSANGDILAKTLSEQNSPILSDDKSVEMLSETTDASGIRATEYKVRETGIRFFEFSIPVISYRIARGREEVGLMFGTDADVEEHGEEIQIGNAKVTFSSARTLNELQTIQRNIAGITVVVALTCILLTVPLVRITIRPIRQLAEGTKAIAAGDPSQRVVAVTNDEIGDLAKSFNQMAIDLEKYHGELRQHSQTLEEKVRERTQELKQTNEQLELANAELRRAQAELIQAAKMAALGEFGAGVAHELNQPLAGIMGYAQLLLGMVPEDSPLKPRLLQIDKQASRMKEITQIMWNLARKSNFEYSFVDVRQPISDSLILITEQFRQHQIEISTEIEDNLPLVYGDANQLHQVFLNFLMNSKDAAEEDGTGKVKIRALPIADMRYVQVQVMDNGRGISTDLIDNIFDPFFTTKPPGKGTGLGLSINFSIIEQHHGFINIHSEELKGTIFSILLPTEIFSRCSKDSGETEEELLAPCWVSSFAQSDSDTRKPDCRTCEIYTRFQKPPPDLSLADDLREFLAEMPSLPSIQ